MRQSRQNYALPTSAWVNITPPVSTEIFIIILKKQRLSLFTQNRASRKIIEKNAEIHIKNIVLKVLGQSRRHMFLRL